MSAISALIEKVKGLRAESERLHDSGAGGFDVCRAWARSVDGVIVELFANAAPDASALPFALVALGGYGRSELNPYSDIDLLFLYDREIARAEGDLPGMTIPALWDLGFKVGHSTRTIADCVRIAQSDAISKTSMIEARHLLGNRAVFDRFQNVFRKDAVARQVDRYLREKRAETEMRHNKYHNSIFLTEPDVKESPGGLRDYHTALWVAAARYGVAGMEGIMGRGLMDMDEANAVRSAIDFALRLRNDIHFMTKSPHNLLDYALQKRTAARLGYAGEGDAPMVSLMRDYYRNADVIRRFSASVQAQARRHRTAAQMFSLLRLRSRQLAPNVHAGEDEIFLKDITAEQLAAEPEKLFAILALMLEKNLAPSNGLRRTLDAVGQLWKQKRPAAEKLAEGLRSLLELPEPVRALELLRDCKLMTAVIPEFHAIRYLTPYDLYHKFTVDEHSFRAIMEFDNLKRNERPECDLLRALYGQEGRKDLIRLALLLHDLGKGDGTHDSEEHINPEIIARLGYAPEDAAVVARLIRLHLLMNNVAQRRDIHQPQTTLDFAGEVGDVPTLKRLYMLTYADTCAVGPDVWNSWKGSLLKELFTLGAACLDSSTDPHRWLAPGRFLTQDKMTPEVVRFVKGMPDKYFFMRQPEEVEEDARLFRRFNEGGGATLLRYRPAGGGAPGELTLVCGNRLGLLYNALGTLTSKNVDILQADILTHREKVAFDLFRVNGPNGQPIDEEGFWKRVEREMARVLAGEKPVEEILRGRKRPPAAKPVPTVDVRVNILNGVSAEHTVVETVARDRIGLLFDITHAISAMKLDIVSAAIATEGHRAVNTFYITDAQGAKIQNPDHIAEIKTGLKKALAPPP